MGKRYENMRQQMQTLKNKLDQQEIVNDRLIRHSMKSTAGNIKRTYFWLIFLSVLMGPYSYWVFVMLSNFSIAFWIATSIFMLVCGGATYYNLFWSGCIGGAIGVIIGLSIHFKTQRQYQSIIDQIEDLTANE